MSDRKQNKPLRERRPEPLFVHSIIDEAGLTPAEFRLLAHFRRRADNHTKRCNPGIPSIARTCRMHEQTVKAAIKSLLTRGVLIVEPHPGQPNSYAIKWEALDTRVSSSTHTRVSSSTHHPPENYTPEGNPDKEIQEGSPSEGVNEGALGALASLDGANPSELTASALRDCEAALAAIREVAPNVTSEEIAKRAQHYRTHFNCAITARALAKHWARCASASNRGARDSQPAAFFK